MSWLRRWTTCADGGSAAPCWSAPSLPCDEWARHFLCSCKEKQKHAAIREPALRAGTLRSGPPRARNSLRSDTRASSPSPDLRCSARYKADLTAGVDPYPHAALVESSHARLTRTARASLFLSSRGWHAYSLRPGEVGLRECKRHGWRAQAQGEVTPQTHLGRQPQVSLRQPRGAQPVGREPLHLNNTRLIARVPMPATRPYTVSWPLA